MKFVWIAVLILKFIVQTFLDWKNGRFIKSHFQKVPQKFEHFITLEEHQKAQSYELEKNKIHLISRIYHLGLLTCFTLGGGINWMYQQVLPLSPNYLIQGLALFALYSVLSFWLNLPESLYETFVLEEKYGHNRTTLKTYIIDIIKMTLLSLVIGAPLLAGVLWFIENFHGTWWIWTFIMLSSFQLLMLIIYPTYLAPLFNKFTPMPEGDLKERILHLLEKTHFHSDGLFVMDASKRSGKGNAYFTGFGRHKRIVFFDTLIENLVPEEVEAILAHELGHFKKKHILKMMIKSFSLSLISLWLLSYLMHSELFHHMHGTISNVSAVTLLLFSLVTSTYTFFFIPINSYFSRKNEFEADQFAAEFSNSKALISALLKLYKKNTSSLTTDPLYSAFYFSHPPAIERIEHLESLN